MYGSIDTVNRNVETTGSVGFQRLSKICLYERPYMFTGHIVGTGLEKAPKGIQWIDRLIGTWKAKNNERWTYFLIVEWEKK